MMCKCTVGGSRRGSYGGNHDGEGNGEDKGLDKVDGGVRERLRGV